MEKHVLIRCNANRSGHCFDVSDWIAQLRSNLTGPIFADLLSKDATRNVVGAASAARRCCTRCRCFGCTGPFAAEAAPTDRRAPLWRTPSCKFSTRRSHPACKSTARRPVTASTLNPSKPGLCQGLTKPRKQKTPSSWKDGV